MIAYSISSLAIVYRNITDVSPTDFLRPMKTTRHEIREPLSPKTEKFRMYPVTGSFLSADPVRDYSTYTVNAEALVQYVLGDFG